jgi:hypothetical protein
MKLDASLADELKLQDLVARIRQAGFCFVPAEQAQAWLMAEDAQALSDWDRFAASWEDMPQDQYMADGGHYRRRRYATLSATAVPCSAGGGIQLQAHRPHFQSVEYNPLNGGVARHFAPILPEIVLGNTMRSVLNFGHALFGQMQPDTAWHIELHQFRIEAGDGVAGKPTPEGIHRDGVDFVLVMMVRRQNISSGTTTMHDLEQRGLDSFTLIQPLDCAIVNDKRCMHGVTPVEQVDISQPAYRDVLVVTFTGLKS